MIQSSLYEFSNPEPNMIDALRAKALRSVNCLKTRFSFDPQPRQYNRALFQSRSSPASATSTQPSREPDHPRIGVVILGCIKAAR